ncbi:fluoride ion transporter CrcB [Pseudomonas amygdali pv. morsprunorum]|nr:fluoride ion transporter CrcB [Pseudomonas amygdali pv. morsprunorum]PPS30145.1 fluoride ion transporter CrcB [Pseudomonas amygdali pv. morsprunorum]
MSTSSALPASRRFAVMLKSLFVIAIGASLGAWLRWLLGMKLNALFPTIPPGTVVANMVGGYIIGLAIALLAASPSLSPEWRLLIITGFCGGLTTFSTFSAETVALIQEGRLLWALGSISLHVVGSLAMTAAGLLSYQMIGTR